MIDDSALFHSSRAYDPAKAREYYLRTRKLKGRNKGGAESTGGRPSAPPPRAPVSKGPRPQTTQEQLEALQARLARLKEVLAQLVEKAKVKSGGEAKESTADKTKSGSSKKGGGEKLTAQQKRDSAKRSKEWREEQRPDLDAVRAQIKDVQTKIQAALEDARKRAAKPQPDNGDKAVTKK